MMNCRDAVGCIVYKLYRLLWNAPEWVSDLFVPFLCVGPVIDNIMWGFIRNRMRGRVLRQL